MRGARGRNGCVAAIPVLVRPSFAGVDEKIMNARRRTEEESQLELNFRLSSPYRPVSLRRGSREWCERHSDRLKFLIELSSEPEIALFVYTRLRATSVDAREQYEDVLNVRWIWKCALVHWEYPNIHRGRIFTNIFVSGNFTNIVTEDNYCDRVNKSTWRFMYMIADVYSRKSLTFRACIY